MLKWFSRLKEDGWTRIERHPYAVWFGWSIATVLLLELASRRSIISLFSFVFVTPHLMMVNFLLVLASYSFMFVTKRWGFARGLSAILWGVIGVVDFILLFFRTTPFNFHDLQLISTAMQVMNHYVSGIGFAAIVMVLLLLVALVLFLFRRGAVYEGRVNYPRGALRVLLSLSLAVYAWAVGRHAGFLPRNFGNIAEAYQQLGLAYCFVNSAVSNGISKPDTYDDKQVEMILRDDVVPESSLNAQPEDAAAVETTVHALPEQETQVALEEFGNRPNVIFLQLESFFDLTELNDVALSEDPIPVTHKLLENYSSGFLSVPSVGAGTANTEFEIMTGMNLDFFGTGEYPYQTVLQEKTCESLAYVLKNYGYTAQAIHNNSANFYSRNTVFSRLGYDRFTSLEYMYGVTFTHGSWAKDEVLTENILEALRLTEGSDYLYTISVQGHGSYPSDAILVNPPITLTLQSGDEARTNQLTYYANEIHEMDRFVGELTEALSAYEEPVMLILYGDHLPSLGIEETELYSGNLFQTKYVLWSNYQMEKRDIDLEAYQLGAMVLSRLGIQDGILFRYHQKYFQEEKPNEAAYLDSMAVIEYDILYGEQLVYEGRTPYRATNLKMGILPITVEEASYTDGKLVLLGQNFNEYSVVVVNGRQYEPTFISRERLELERELTGTVSVCVAQVDDYGKTILSSTRTKQVRIAAEEGQ